jgi:hypothetical protein
MLLLAELDLVQWFSTPLIIGLVNPAKPKALAGARGL